MALAIREHLIFEWGPHETLPGVWWIRLSDKEIILITPWVMFGLYNWSWEFNTMRLRRGWTFSWKRAPVNKERRIFLKSRERVEYRWPEGWAD